MSACRSVMLHLKRSPGIRSWSLLIGIVSIGLAAAYYSSDSILWKLFFVTCCLFVAMQNTEEWEEAVFDKTKKVIELKTFSLYALILAMCRRGQEKVVMDMRHMRDVCVQEEKVRYLGKGYLLVLRLATGFSYPLTQSATMGWDAVMWRQWLCCSSVSWVWRSSSVAGSRRKRQSGRKMN
ncbi:cytochrome b-245 chaperone 1 homolog isoform X2 [Oncorhynchus masou masou]|uniref:cytochrome b-245 chaperone 1 homolog isoform X2 n=1 Tax=Oncorhynchus masou masou TaxID=90313 RepID=UPI003182CDB1